MVKRINIAFDDSTFTKLQRAKDLYSEQRGRSISWNRFILEKAGVEDER